MTDQRTIEHITSATTSAHSCGCEHRLVNSDGTQRWFLCGFHEGYEAGLEAADMIRDDMIRDDMIRAAT